MVVEVLAATPRWERVVVLLPAFVVGIGLVVAVLILLGRAFAASVRESGHPRLLLGGAVVLIGAIALMTWLGVTLPRE